MSKIVFLLSFLILSATNTVNAQQLVKVSVETEIGKIKLELYPGKAPVTVKNFLQYVDLKHYEGGCFFRSVRNDNQPDSREKIDVVQAGPHPWFQFFDLDPIPLERTSQTGLKHVLGAISMARETPDSATSSFFICLKEEPQLDFGGKRNPDGQGFATFGEVVDGMEVVREIHTRECNGQAIRMPVRIVKITYQISND